MNFLVLSLDNRRVECVRPYEQFSNHIPDSGCHVPKNLSRSVAAKRRTVNSGLSGTRPEDKWERGGKGRLSRGLTPHVGLPTASRHPTFSICVLSPSGGRPGSERESPGSRSPCHPLLCSALSSHPLFLKSSLGLSAQLPSLASDSVYVESWYLTEGPGPAQDPICPQTPTCMHTHTLTPSRFHMGPKSETG